MTMWVETYTIVFSLLSAFNVFVNLFEYADTGDGKRLDVIGLRIGILLVMLPLTGRVLGWW